MRSANLVENTGTIFSRANNAFLGSCFLFRYPSVALTAHHCVAGANPEDVLVAFPGSRAAGTAFSVREIVQHPCADLVILIIDAPNEKDITWVVNDLFDDFAYGVDVMAYGYPADWVEFGSKPSPRLFKGHIQRFHQHRSQEYKYVAAELSFGCPGGLSGSAIVNSQFQGRLYGLVTENIRASTQVNSFVETQKDGKEYRETYQDYINYGSAVWLPALRDWIDTHVPPPPHDEILRRTNNQHKWAADERAPS